MTTISVNAEARLRSRNQLTLPDTIVRAAGIVEGDRFIVETDADDPDTVRLHRIRATYAGALRDIYVEVAAYPEEERERWSPG
mgnify:CR=1 FL=1